MSAGATLLDLFGQGDPRAAILQRLQGQPAGGVQGGAGTDPAAGTAGQPGASGAGVQAMQDNVDGYKSPSDLATLYKDLLKMNNRAANIDRGLGLIGSAISRDGNREATMSAFTGENAPNASAGMDQIASTILEFNKAQVAQQQRAAALASLPSIADRYGLSMEAARYLMETGELENVIKEAEKPNVELREDANGQVMLIDKNSGNLRGTFGPQKDARTDDMKEYDASKADPAFRQYQVDMKRAGATSNEINMPAGEKALDQELGKLDAESVRKMRDASYNASQMLDMYDLVEQGIETGVTTGKLGDAELALRKFGQYIGLDTDAEKIAGGELIKSVQNRMALMMRNPDSGMGMPGSVSDKDLQFLKEAQIGIDNSPQGNKALLEAFRRIEKRKIQVARMAEDYLRENRSMAGFESEVRKYAEENPLFTKDNFKVSVGDPESRRKALREKYGIK